MPMHSRVALLAFALGVAASCVPAAGLPREALIERWSAAIDEYNVPSVVVAVVRDGEVVLSEAFGRRDHARSLPATPDTLYYIASTTKSFTALAVLRLVDQGLIDLDAPVTRYLPRFELAGEPLEKPMRVRDLLTHARGLAGEEPLSLHEAYTGHEIDDDFFYSRLGAYVQATGAFRYGNLHYTLLGRVIEAASGRGWKAYVREEVLTPAGMNRTTSSIARARRLGNVADMMDFKSPSEWGRPDLEKTEGAMSAAGGMYASASDLARWLTLHMNDGEIGGRRVVSADAVKMGRSAQVEVGSRFGEFQREAYGMGWYVGSYAGETLVHCFGAFLSGARAHVSYMPEHGVGVVALTNVARGPGYQLTDAIAADVYDAVLGRESPPERIESLRARLHETPRDSLAQLPPPTRENNPAVAPDGLSADPAAYTGVFANPEFGRVRFFDEGGELRMSYGGMRRIALTTFRGPDTFVMFLLPRRMAAVGQFLVEGGRVDRVALDLPGTPEGVAVFERD